MDEAERANEIRVRVMNGLLSDVELPDDLTIVARVEGEPVPDLSLLEPEQWPAAMQPLGRRARTAAIGTLERWQNASLVRLIDELPRIAPRRDAARRSAIDDPPARPLPQVSARRAARQVCFRLTDEQHERLTEAAQLLGHSPAALAKAFCLSGTNRALSE